MFDNQSKLMVGTHIISWNFFSNMINIIIIRLMQFILVYRLGIVDLLYHVYLNLVHFTAFVIKINGIYFRERTQIVWRERFLFTIVGCATTCLLLDCCGGKSTLGSFMIKRKHSEEKTTMTIKFEQHTKNNNIINIT